MIAVVGSTAHQAYGRAGAGASCRVGTGRRRLAGAMSSDESAGGWTDAATEPGSSRRHGDRAGRRRPARRPRGRRPRRVRRAGPPAPRPAVGGGAAHDRRPGGGLRRPAGRLRSRPTATPPRSAASRRSPPGCTASWSTPASTGCAGARSRPTVPLPEEDGETGRRGIADPRDDLDRLELRMEIDKALAALPARPAGRDRPGRRRGALGGRRGRGPRRARRAR